MRELDVALSVALGLPASPGVALEPS